MESRTTTDPEARDHRSAVERRSETKGSEPEPGRDLAGKPAQHDEIRWVAPDDIDYSRLAYHSYPELFRRAAKQP